MKKLPLLFMLTLLLNGSSAQLSKGTWLVGGTGLFTSSTRHATVSDMGPVNIAYRHTQLSFSPNAGYFLSDKFAAGIKLAYSNTRQKLLSTPGLCSKYIDYSVGPFVRYYFLPKNRGFNLLAEGGHQYGVEKSGSTLLVDGRPATVVMNSCHKHAFSIAAGPVIFFNPLIGLECLVSYSTVRYAGIKLANSAFQAGVGLQVHL